MEIVNLHAACARCKGHGLIPGAQLPERCPRCSGSGMILSEEGRTILGLLKLADKARSSGAGQRGRPDGPPELRAG